MGISEDLIVKAEKLSANSLKSGKWDTEAFLVLSMVDLLRHDQVASDTAPETRPKTIRDNFFQYQENPCVDTLKAMLEQDRQILSEIFQSCSCQAEMDIFLDFVSCLQKIT